VSRSALCLSCWLFVLLAACPAVCFHAVFISYYLLILLSAYPAVYLSCCLACPTDCCAFVCCLRLAVCSPKRPVRT
jgi:hypothetical protein